MDLVASQDQDGSDTSLYQAVLMDHEYEFYRPWNDFMDGIIYPDVIDQVNPNDDVNGMDINDTADIQNEVEIAQESWIFHQNAAQHRNVIDLEIPPSPATASLQDLLQQAYKETQVEAQDIIPYEEHQATMHEQGDGKDLNLDILDDIETIICSPHQVSFSEITSSEPYISNSKSVGLLQATTSSINDMTGDSTSNFRKNFMENSSERSERFKSGLKYIEAKVKRMRMRTGAIAGGIAEYEGEQYSFESCSNSFRVLESETWEYIRLPTEVADLNVSEIPTNGDDHRYAAQIVTQSSSSATVSDHQYENRGSGVVDSLGDQEVNILAQTPGSAQTISKPSFEKRTYERNKSFQRHVHVLFSEVVKRLEEQTGGSISLTVSYQNEVFTKLNYENARHIFDRRRRNRPTITPVPVITRHINKESSSSPSASASLSKEISLPDCWNHPVPISSSVTNSNPHCFKCHSSTLLTDFGKTDDGFIAWVRCADPLCSYLVHSACIGFRINSKKSLRRLPPFFCEAHRD